MKVKEVEVTANVAWSPAQLEEVRVAAGTAAQQLDATFSTNSALEVSTSDKVGVGVALLQTGGCCASLDLPPRFDGERSSDAQGLLGPRRTQVSHWRRDDQPPAGTHHPIRSSFRYHKLIWGSAGISEGARPCGILAAGLDHGVVTLYDAEKLARGATEEAVVASKDKHTGPVQAMDFNPFQVGIRFWLSFYSSIYSPQPPTFRFVCRATCLLPAPPSPRSTSGT